MDVIREHLMYKNTPLMICMAKLSPQEQYECIRVLLESQTPVKLCLHETTNEFLQKVAKELPVTFVQCWVEETVLPVE